MSYGKTKIFLNRPSDKAVSFESSGNLEYFGYIRNKVEILMEVLGLPSSGISSSEMARASVYVDPTLIDHSMSDEFTQGLLAGILTATIVEEGGDFEEEDNNY